MKLNLWIQKKGIKQKEWDILKNYCGINPLKTNSKTVQIDSKTGQIDLKYEPMNINKDYM